MNRKMPVMPDMPVGSELDMAQLLRVFASKNPPDNTIVRIEELEKQVKGLMEQGPQVKTIRHVETVKEVGAAYPEAGNSGPGLD